VLGLRDRKQWSDLLDGRVEEFVLDPYVDHLGGRLVFRHLVGVDHVDGRLTPREFVPVLAETELAEDSPQRGRRRTAVSVSSRIRR